MFRFYVYSTSIPGDNHTHLVTLDHCDVWWNLFAAQITYHVVCGKISWKHDANITGAKLDGLTRSLSHPRWRESEAMCKHGSVRKVTVWVGLFKCDYYFAMILGTIEQKETLKIPTNTVVSSVRKMAQDGLTSILGWANFVCAPGFNRLTRLGMD